MTGVVAGARGRGRPRAERAAGGRRRTAATRRSPRAVGARRVRGRADARLLVLLATGAVWRARGLEIYVHGPSAAIFAFPTNDELMAVFVAWPIAELPRVRADLERELHGGASSSRPSSPSGSARAAARSAFSARPSSRTSCARRRPRLGARRRRRLPQGPVHGARHLRRAARRRAAGGRRRRRPDRPPAARRRAGRLPAPPQRGHAAGLPREPRGRPSSSRRRPTSAAWSPRCAATGRRRTTSSSPARAWCRRRAFFNPENLGARDGRVAVAPPLRKLQGSLSPRPQDAGLASSHAHSSPRPRGTRA